MNILKNLRLVSGGSGKKSGLGLILSMAKKELQRTEGMLKQVQEVRWQHFWHAVRRMMLTRRLVSGVKHADPCSAKPAGEA